MYLPPPVPRPRPDARMAPSDCVGTEEEEGCVNGRGSTVLEGSVAVRAWALAEDWALLHRVRTQGNTDTHAWEE